VPIVIPALIKAGFEVIVETDAGILAGYPDSQYTEKGAQIVATRSALFEKADIILQVLAYGSNDITGKNDLPLLRRNQILIGFLSSFGSRAAIQEITARRINAFSVVIVDQKI